MHKKGLLHREVHIWFYTPDGKIIFQHRAKNKDTFPDQLDATAGGHADLGMEGQDSAVKEVQEETGVMIALTDLKYITMVKRKTFDQATNKINNVIRKIYAYLYEGKLEDLKDIGDSDEVQDFESWDIDVLLDKKSDKTRILPALLDEDSIQIYRKIKDLTK